MERVLLINDCKFESMIMKDMLESFQYEVKITTEYYALLQVRDYDPDIVIANMIMKEILGYELISKIKKQKPEVICLLSSSNDIALEKFKAFNVDAVIHTPVKKDTLYDILNNITKKEACKSKDENNAKDAEMIIRRLVNKTANSEKTLETTNIKETKVTFCPYCGQKFNESMSNIKFCPYCGEKIKIL